MPDVKISKPLSIRKAQIIAEWLREAKDAEITSSACMYQTPEQIAEKVLGNGNRGIAGLADEIRARLLQK